jgi:hypothetical protein
LEQNGRFSRRNQRRALDRVGPACRMSDHKVMRIVVGYRDIARSQRKYGAHGYLLVTTTKLFD